MFTRRSVLTAGAVTLLAAPAIVRGQALFATDPFRLGIAAGDPTADGFVIWTRLAPEPLDEHGGMPMVPVPLQWQVATDRRFEQVVRSGDTLARPELGHSVHVEVAGLQPDRPYFYRFTIGREHSVTGRARTAPLETAALNQLRIGVCGCQHYEYGLFTAYRYLAGEEDLAFVFHYGDYIYEYRDTPVATDRHGAPIPVVREHAGQECFTLTDYRRRYAQYKMDPDLQAAHAAQTWFATFDDHEVANNWTGDHDPHDAPAAAFLLRRAAAFQAWYENMPVRASLIPSAAGIRMARRAQYGTLADFHFMDTRQFRSPQPCGDGFKPACPGVGDPGASILGRPQEDALVSSIRGSRARWSVLAQQVMMMDLDRRTQADEREKLLNIDSWAGYATPRRRFLEKLKGRNNLVVLTGDEHQNFAGQVTVDGEPVAVEFVGTSITSGGDGQDRRAGSDRILAENPNLKFINDQRGYLVCDIGADEWRTEFKVLDKVTVPNGALSTRARWAVARGTPDLRQV